MDLLEHVDMLKASTQMTPISVFFFLNEMTPISVKVAPSHGDDALVDATNF